VKVKEKMELFEWLKISTVLVGDPRGEDGSQKVKKNYQL
jgi:hypothetical protein